MFQLVGSIFIDNKDADDSLAKTEQKANSLAGKLGEGVKTAGKWAAGIAVGVGGAATAMFGIMNQTAAAADEIDKLSERTGINREELQRWKYAAGQSGADIGKLEVGMKTLSAAVVGVEEGSKKSIEAFGALGISMDGLKEKSQEDIFAEVMKALADMPQGAERNALGNDLLGKSYTELMPLLNAGSEGMNDLMNRADELGIVLSEDAIKSNVAFGDSLADVQQSIGAVVQKVSSAFIPILMLMLNWVLDHMPEIQQVIGVAFGAIQKVVEVAWTWFDQYLLPVFDKLFKWTMEHWPGIQAQIKSVFDVISPLVSALWRLFADYLLPIFASLFTWVSTYFAPIGSMIGSALGTVIGFITDTVNWISGLITKIQEVIGWFKNLFGFNNQSVNVKTNVSTAGPAPQVDGRHATGLDYVPYDGYIAELHKGERVVPANQNKAQSISVFVELDSGILAKAIGQPLVDMIRVKTGTRL